MRVCQSWQTNPKIPSLPVINVDLDINPEEKTTMLVDTGAQISLINRKAITNPSLINTNNKVTISSIHGSERTLGEITTTLQKDNIKIPILLQVTKNSAIKEDGILGYDIIGEKAIINGPSKTILIDTGKSYLKFPIEEYKTPKSNTYTINIEEEITCLNLIEYLNEKEINPQYEINLQRVRSITHEINSSKIKIN